MCLTFLLSQYKQRVQPLLKIHALTIDHGYRPDSAEEARKVGEIVHKWGVEHSVVKLLYLSRVHSISNFEEVARALRYEKFLEMCISKGIYSLLVAHNLDDKLETFLQRLQMNSTLYGLCGLKRIAPLPGAPKGPNVEENITVHRPLLHFDKSAIQETCLTNGIRWFEDATNADTSLTKRNLLRFMINEYVPQKLFDRPELSCLSKELLVKTTSEVEAVVSGLEKQVDDFDMTTRASENFDFRAESATIKFSMLTTDWDAVGSAVSSRWLYRLVSPFSSAKHLHWSYAKIERHAATKIREFLEGASKVLHMTYLNMAFEVSKNEDYLHFHITRQNPMTEKPLLEVYVTQDLLPWYLIDRCWWVRLQTEKKTRVVATHYAPHMKSRLKVAFPDFCRSHEGNSLVSAVGVVPVLLDKESGDILALPTHGLMREYVKVECVLKDPIHNYI